MASSRAAASKLSFVANCRNSVTSFTPATRAISRVVAREMPSRAKTSRAASRRRCCVREISREPLESTRAGRLIRFQYSSAMRFPLVIFFSLACAVLAADDSWEKVRELKSGTELRIFQHGNPKPLLANLDEATEDKLVIATKTEQRAIAKEEIERLDYRPNPKGGSKVTRETRTKISN